jgi:hypothetical protein
LPPTYTFGKFIAGLDFTIGTLGGDAKTTIWRLGKLFVRVASITKNAFH